MQNTFTSSFKKEDGSLVCTTSSEEKRFQDFLKNIPEGKTVVMLLEPEDASKSLAQLAKVHKCIRLLASEIGYTFEEMKLAIKERAGLTVGDLTTSEGYAKSFGKCSVEEINLAIQACIEVGDTVNTNLR